MRMACEYAWINYVRSLVSFSSFFCLFDADFCWDESEMMKKF